jgi:hypothetical protein
MGLYWGRSAGSEGNDVIDLVAVLIEVFVQEDLLIRVDPVRWSAGRMDGGWLMGFADVAQDLVEGAVSVMAAPGILPPAALAHPCTSKAMMRIVAP